MNATALLFLIVSVGAILLLPRKWAPVPLLATCCYMTLGEGVELGGVSLPIFRMVLAAGIARVFLKHERLAGSINGLDKLIIALGVWLIFASLFHEWIPGSGPTYATGFVIDFAAIYFLTRIWCHDLSELMAVLRVLAWLIVPVAVAMIAEHILERNLFSIFGGVSEDVHRRDGKIRAQGPFLHPILAGTVGAACFPLMVAIWRRYRLSSMVGMTASVAMVLASTSSGPLMSLLFGAGALLLWLRRPWLRAIRWGVVVLYVLAEIAMTRPAYYLISKIDLTGSSTSWYRSRLIESAFEHLPEWWAFGTDNTGHWMPNPIDSRHADITNYYIFFGTIGGLPAMLLLIAIFWRCFIQVGKGVSSPAITSQEQRFMIWCLGAGLFAHAATSISVAYFDQSMTFIWLNVGVISSMYSVVAMGAATERVPGASAARTVGPGRRRGVAKNAPATSFARRTFKRS